MNVLGIESSCDETAAAVVRDGHYILSNVVASQTEIHAQYGGVVPELASRQHLLRIVPVVQKALDDGHLTWRDIDLVAVTYGPGLAGSLMVGFNMAKGLAYAHSLPLIGINHLEGHIYANWLVEGDRIPEQPSFPILALIVSGGHSNLVLVDGHGKYQLLGKTRDDAAGEAFDKVARILGLGFPGGPAIQKIAEKGDPTAFELPHSVMKGKLDFSFSGLKTAVLRTVESYLKGSERGIRHLRPSQTLLEEGDGGLRVAGLASSFQQAMVDIMIEKTVMAVDKYRVRQVILGGGVAANLPLREQMSQRLPVPVSFPPTYLCIDNAAMIAACAYYRFQAGERHGWDLDVVPNLTLP